MYRSQRCLSQFTVLLLECSIILKGPSLKMPSIVHSSFLVCLTTVERKDDKLMLNSSVKDINDWYER